MNSKTHGNASPASMTSGDVDMQHDKRKKDNTHQDKRQDIQPSNQPTNQAFNQPSNQTNINSTKTLIQ